MPSSPLSRRSFVISALGVAAALPAFDGRSALAATSRLGSNAPAWRLRAADRLGPLLPVADDRDGVSRLLLPEGFSYRSFGVAGEAMTDGNVCPGAHDGSGVFAMPDGRLRLIRNHEIDEASVDAVPLAGDKAYDSRAGGGTTTVELEVLPDGSVEVLRDFVSLNGTHTNCSGGRTPWGSWLSCEETIEDDRPFVVNEENDEFQNGFERRHGYVFEVPSTADGIVDPEPLVAMGRFMHEAVTVDPRSGDCYMTEDSDVAAFYRFRPSTPGHLADGGVLSALRIKGSPRMDLRGGIGTGTRFEVDWVPIEEPDPNAGETYEDAAQGVYRQADAAGASTFTGLEGCTWSEATGTAVFLSTAGGAAGCGQVWAYHPDPANDGGMLELLFESPATEVLNYPDAVAVDPAGTIVIAEDGVGTALLRGITAEGETFPIAHAADETNDPSGPTFSPDGTVLFFNIMGEDPPLDPGMSFAMWGPWERLR